MGRGTIPGIGRAPLGPAVVFALAAALAGCATAPEPAPAQRATAVETGTPPEHREPETTPNGESLHEFYANVENQLVASGRLRRDVAPADAPYSTDDLVRDFERIALYDEYLDVGGRYLHSETPSHLRRWNRPVRVAVMTGSSVPPEEAARDRANVAAFTYRLARLTGLDMALGSGPEVNLLVLFMTREERMAFAEQVATLYPSFGPAVLSQERETPLDVFCATYAYFDDAVPGTYSTVLILIRAEQPPLTRLSCVNEEMAQAMGLPNDSPEARPSIFTNTFEFALLTDHDAILLRMLYDPRLAPGMTAEQARPLLHTIARDAQAAQMRGDPAPTQVATN